MNVIYSRGAEDRFVGEGGAELVAGALGVVGFIVPSTSGVCLMRHYYRIYIKRLDF